MSYSILVYKKNEHSETIPCRDIPFAGMKTYREQHWPKIGALGLTLVEKFRYGVSLTKPELLQLIEEVIQLLNHTIDTRIQERLEFVITELKLLRDTEDYEEIHIG